MLRDLTTADFKTVENIMSQLNKLHFENRPDFYLNNKQSITKKEYKSLLKNPKKICIAYIIDTKIVGICLVTIKNKIEKSIYIDDIFVLDKYRQQGIGTLLYDKIKSTAKEIDAKRIDLTVWQFNKPAIKFYNSLGMTTQRTILETRLE